MGKITVPALAEFIALATGFHDSNLRSISRRLREAGLLSQAGHGRGAATATPHDAALLLLVAACEVPPLHAATLGEALLACDILNKDDWPDDIPLAATAIDQMAMLIAWPYEIYRIMIIVAGSVSVLFHTDEGSLSFGPATDDPANAKLASALGRRFTHLRHRHEIPAHVVHDIGDRMREATAEADD